MQLSSARRSGAQAAPHIRARRPRRNTTAIRAAWQQCVLPRRMDAFETEAMRRLMERPMSRTSTRPHPAVMGGDVLVWRSFPPPGSVPCRKDADAPRATSMQAVQFGQGAQRGSMRGHCRPWWKLRRDAARGLVTSDGPTSNGRGTASISCGRGGLRRSSLLWRLF